MFHKINTFSTSILVWPSHWFEWRWLTHFITF